MTEENKAQSFTDIWSMKDDVLAKNDQVKKEIFDIPNEEMVSNNVNGFVINAVGNIVAQFGFFVETDGKERLDLKVSPDGFMAAIYNKPTNIILGYGHPLGFTGLIDPKESNILHLGPDQANGEDIIISVDNDDKLKKQGLVCMLRDVDVMMEILTDDVKEDFLQSLEEATDPVEDLNEIETTYNEYMKHIYKLLGELYNTKDNIEREEGIIDE